MSIFGNEEGIVGTRIAPDHSKGSTGFEALGKPVPMERRSEANRHMKEMGIQDPEKRFSCIERMSHHIGRDDAHGAMQAAYGVVDVTGTYRLLAVLLTDPVRA